MPILPREIDLHPPDILESAADLPWLATYTLSRREKELMRQLRQLDIGFYCPLIPKRNRSPSGRIRVSHVPLFAGYVFVQADDEQRQLALTTNCISRTIPVSESEQLLADLQQIQKLIALDTPLAPESRIKAGQRVRVKSGLLAGVEGTVTKRHSGDRLLVVVGFLQQGASVALDDFQVEPI
jgi:transcriptional antiterminator RfaH